MPKKHTPHPETKGKLRKISLYLYDSELRKLKAKLNALGFDNKTYLARFFRKLLSSEFVFITSSVKIKIQDDK